MFDAVFLNYFYSLMASAVFATAPSFVGFFFVNFFSVSLCYVDLSAAGFSVMTKFPGVAILFCTASAIAANEIAE